MDREELKKRVRALLISSKQGCTPRSLLKDYKGVFGEDLPLRDFGYRDVLEMAYDMPDVVRTLQQGALLRGVADESTQHIAKMVARQKNTGYHQMKAEQPVRRTTTPSIPFHIQGRVRQLLYSYPNGLPIEQFEQAYAGRFGYYLSLQRLKCNSLQDLINYLPDLLKIERDANGRTMIVGGEASRQPSFNSVETDGRPRVPHHVNQKPPRFQGKLLNGQSQMISSQLSTYDDPSPTTGTPSPVIEVQPKVVNHSHQTNGPQPSSAGNAWFIPVLSGPVGVKENILKLLQSKHLGIWLTSLQAEYKDMFGQEIELTPFKSIMEMLSHMKDVCTMEKPSSAAGDWLVKSKVYVNVETEGQSQDKKPPTDFKESISRLLSDHPSGIPLEDIPVFFKEKYHTDMPLGKWGYQSTASLVNSIPGIAKKIFQNGQMRVFPVDQTNNAGTKKSKTMLPTPIPAEPVVPSEYSTVVLPQSASINLQVSHVVSPSQFFIRLIGKDHSHALNTLMETISKYYCNATGIDGAIARPLLGQACCALFDSNDCWYRAEVVSIPTPFTVIVKYVDYGNKCELPIGSIRKSRPEYLQLPAQCIECCLANVQPKERVWNDEACRVFREAVIDKPLVGVIQQSMMGHPFHIKLCDTSTIEDVYIHKLLVAKGFAVEYQVPVTPTTSEVFMSQFMSLQKALVQQQHLLQVMATGQLGQMDQTNKMLMNNDSMQLWPQPNPSTSLYSASPNLQSGMKANETQLTAKGSEHRKKMAAAKDIWSSDSETEDEKNASGGTLKQLETKLERLNEERKEILGRMSYESTTGSISGLVEKLKNVEAAIKATRERMERRASGLPPLPPPGLSPVYTSTKQKPQASPSSSIATSITTSSQKPRGVTSVKPIIGLGRGKKFSKQNSFPSAFDDVSTITSDTGSVSSNDLKSSSSSSSSSVIVEPKEHQPVTSSSGLIEQNNLQESLYQLSAISQLVQPQQLNVTSATVSSSVLLNPVPAVANGSATSNSTAASLTTTSFVAPTADQVAKSFAKLSAKSQAVPFSSISSTSQTITPTPPVTSQVSALIPSRSMTYSSAVASYPTRKQPTPLFQPAMPPPQRMPPMPPPLLATPMHHPMIGLGRGNVPWAGGPPPPPHVWGGNGGPWMQQVPPPAMPLHFDHHHNPFYEIPPLGSSSGLDII